MDICCQEAPGREQAALRVLSESCREYFKRWKWTGQALSEVPLSSRKGSSQK